MPSLPGLRGWLSASHDKRRRQLAARGERGWSSHRTRTRTAKLVAASLAFATSMAAAGDLRNWFDDPFFRLSHAMADCPEPAGPRVTEAERRLQSHRRAEKGTTCWLAKEQECERPSAYAYDYEIAAAVRNALAEGHLLVHSSLWATVQGRVVYVEGCVHAETDASAIEALLRGLPHVQQVLAIVTTNPKARPPYRVFGRQ